MDSSDEVNAKAFDAALLAIGDRVRRARERKSITQQELARRIHFGRSTISNIEAGRCAASVRLLLAISHELGENVLTES